MRNLLPPLPLLHSCCSAAAPAAQLQLLPLLSCFRCCTAVAVVAQLLLLLCVFVAVVNYDALRAEAKQSFAAQIGVVRGYVGKLQKAQRAAEKALDM